jgi:hypothetical protein
MTPTSYWFVLLLMVVLVGLASACWRRRHLHQRPAPSASRMHRLLKPRTPDDCPACRQQGATTAVPAYPPVRPWHERKRYRGAPKRIATDGFACPTPSCDYYRVTDAQVHALVGDGRHGKAEHIQTFLCWLLRSSAWSIGYG